MASPVVGGSSLWTQDSWLGVLHLQYSKLPEHCASCGPREWELQKALSRRKWPGEDCVDSLAPDIDEFLMVDFLWQEISGGREADAGNVRYGRELDFKEGFRIATLVISQRRGGATLVRLVICFDNVDDVVERRKQIGERRDLKS